MGACGKSNCQRTPEHQERIELSSPRYEGGVLPLDDQCLLSSVGSLGLEPRPARLRAGDAAANTSIPFVCFSVRPVGFEPTPTRVKTGDAAVTPRPQNWSGVCVSSGMSSTSFFLLVVEVVRGGVEPATGDLSDRHAHRYNTGPCSSRDGGTRTHDSVLPRHVGCRSPTSRNCLSVRTVGFEPTISWPPARRDAKLRHVLLQVPRTGVEPVLPA